MSVSNEQTRLDPQALKPPLRVVKPPADPEDLTLNINRRSRYADLHQQTEVSLRSRRALSVYGTMMSAPDREYFRSLMGIDEHV